MRRKYKNLSKIISKVLEHMNLKYIGDIFMRAGIPDIIACYKGRFIGIEVKDGNNVASELQLAHR